MAGLYLDEEVTGSVRDLLRQAVHDVVTTGEAGWRGASDAEQLLFATAEGRTLVTHNCSHFEALQVAWRMWADAWSGVPRPQPLAWGFTVRLIDEFLRSGSPMENRFYDWQTERG